MTVTCPNCAGEGGGQAFVNRGEDISKHSVEWITCRTCNGDGKITDERAECIAAGKRMRDVRVAKQETLLVASRRMGISPAELSDVEHGRAPPLYYQQS